MKNVFLGLFGVGIIIMLWEITQKITGSQNNRLFYFTLVTWIAYIIYKSFNEFKEKI